MRANQNRQLLTELSSSKNNIVGLLYSSSSRFPFQLCFVNHSIGSLWAGRIALKINLQSKKDGNADTKCSICNLMENECHFLNFCKMYHDIRQKNPSRYIHVRNSTCVTYIITGKQVHRTRDVAMFIFNAFQQQKEMLSSF